jgi:hypothetical protein
MWIPDEGELPTRPRRTIAGPERMLAVFWSALGFPRGETLPKGIDFDSQYFSSNVLSAIAHNRSSETPEDRRRKMAVHFDITTSHTAN